MKVAIIAVLFGLITTSTAAAGPHHRQAASLAITVARLPKTRSGKILRGTIKKIADGDQWTMPATIDDPAILDEITGALRGHGVGG